MAVNYKDSGVDVEEGYNAVNEYKVHAKRTRIPGLLTDLGSFNGMFEVPKGIKNPVMVSFSAVRALVRVLTALVQNLKSLFSSKNMILSA